MAQTVALVLAEGIEGMTEPSATRRPSTPCTRRVASTTEGGRRPSGRCRRGGCTRPGFEHVLPQAGVVRRLRSRLGLALAPSIERVRLTDLPRQMQSFDHGGEVPVVAEVVRVHERRGARIRARETDAATAVEAGSGRWRWCSPAPYRARRRPVCGRGRRRTGPEGRGRQARPGCAPGRTPRRGCSPLRDRTCRLVDDVGIGWSCRFSPTPGRSTTTSTPVRRRCPAGPTPESISSCG